MFRCDICDMTIKNVPFRMTTPFRISFSSLISPMYFLNIFSICHFSIIFRHLLETRQSCLSQAMTTLYKSNFITRSYRCIIHKSNIFICLSSDSFSDFQSLGQSNCFKSVSGTGMQPWLGLSFMNDSLLYLTET